MTKYLVLFTLISGAKCDKYKIYMYGDNVSDIRKQFRINVMVEYYV